jgi:hypothetical protein
LADVTISLRIDPINVLHARKSGNVYAMSLFQRCVHAMTNRGRGAESVTISPDTSPTTARSRTFGSPTLKLSCAQRLAQSELVGRIERRREARLIVAVDED